MLPFAEQELTDATFTSTAEDTTITFTRVLAPASEGKQILSVSPGDETNLIWAIGQSEVLAYHGEDPNRGALLVDLACSDAPTVTPTVTPTGVNASVSPTMLPGETMSPTANNELPDDMTMAPDFVDSVAPTSTPPDGVGASAAPSAMDGTAGPTDFPSDGAVRLGGSRWVAVVAGIAAMFGAAVALSW